MLPRKYDFATSLALLGVLLVLVTLFASGRTKVSAEEGYCGDGIMQEGEECDAGPYNGRPGSLCLADCTLRYLACFTPTCGCYLTGQSAANILGQEDSVSNTYGSWNGALRRPMDIAVNPKHHLLYIADSGNDRVVIHKLDTNNKVQSTVPVANITSLNVPSGLALDVQGNRLFVSIDGAILAYADVAPPPAQLSTPISINGGAPRGIAYSRRGYLYAAYPEEGKLVRYDLRGGLQQDTVPPSVSIEQYVVNGSSSLSIMPTDVLYDPEEEMVYMADAQNRRVVAFREQAIGDGVPVADHVYGTGAPHATAESIGFPQGLTMHGGRLFVSDGMHNRVLVFDKRSPSAFAALGQQDMYTGDASPASASTMRAPAGIASLAETCQLFVTDSDNHRILVFGDNPTCLPPPSPIPQIVAISSRLPDTVTVSLNVPFLDGVSASHFPWASGTPQIASVERVGEKAVRLTTQGDMEGGQTYALHVSEDGFQGDAPGGGILEETFMAPSGLLCEMIVVQGWTVCCPSDHCLCQNQCTPNEMCQASSGDCVDLPSGQESSPPASEGENSGLPPPAGTTTGGIGYGGGGGGATGDTGETGDTGDTDGETVMPACVTYSQPCPTRPDPNDSCGAIQKCQPHSAGGCSCQSCPYAELWNGEEWVYQQNMLKGNAMKSMEKTTYERIRTEITGEEIRIKVSESGNDRTYLNALSLLQIDHPLGTRAYLDHAGNAWSMALSGASLTPVYEKEDGRDIIELENLGAYEGVIVTGGIDMLHYGALRNEAFADARLHCVPGVYRMLDALPREQARKLARNVAGIEIFAYNGDEWRLINDGTLILEHDEDVFVPLNGAQRLRLSIPEGGHVFTRFEGVNDIRALKAVREIAPPHSSLSAPNAEYLTITPDSPVEFVFATLPGNALRTFYLRSHGYYHYEADGVCEQPSYRYDMLLYYLSRAL